MTERAEHDRAEAEHAPALEGERPKKRAEGHDHHRGRWSSAHAMTLL